MQAVCVNVASQGFIIVDQHGAARKTPGQRHDLTGELRSHVCRQRFVAQLNQAQAALHGLFKPAHFRLDAIFGGIRQGINMRQFEAAQDRAVGRQYGRNGGCRAKASPHRAGVFERTNFSVPGVNMEKLQANMGVRIDELPGNPRPGLLDDDAQFFLQFAIKRFTDAFAGFNLAAGEFPVTGIGLARRALRQQKFRTVVAFAENDASCDIGDGGHLRFFDLAGILRPPDQSLANCQATRPLREPRISAQLSASRSARATSCRSQPKCVSQWPTMSR